MAKNRKVDILAQAKGSVAGKLLTERERQAARLEKITGIKQPRKNKRKKPNRKMAKRGPTFE
jgi:hypothetical protein